MSLSGMNHACECGHGPAEHYGETGGCEAYEEGTDWPCKCPRYEWGGDD